MAVAFRAGRHREAEGSMSARPEPLLAALFDMDGTLIDNMRFHGRAWVETTRRLFGREEEPELFSRTWAGLNNREILNRLAGREVTPEEFVRWNQEKEELYHQLYRPHLAPLDGARELLAALRGAGRATALATASSHVNRVFVLDGLELRSAFDAVVGMEDVPRGKPAPDLFLEAAARVDVEPSACVVFEDAVYGILAARAAGMLPVGLTTIVSEAELREAGAVYVVDDFTALPARLLEALGLAVP